VAIDCLRFDTLFLLRRAFIDFEFGDEDTSEGLKNEGDAEEGIFFPNRFIMQSRSERATTAKSEKAPQVD